MDMDFLVRGDHLIQMDEGGNVIADAGVAVRHGLIEDVGPFDVLAAKHTAKRIIGGKGMVIMPGFVNSHSHAPMVLMRGMADDLPLKEWLENHIWPAENKWLSEEFVRDAARLACLEMIRSGTTSFCDMYFFEGVVAEVASEMGMRSVLTAGVIDFPTTTTAGADDCLAKARANIEKFRDMELVTPGIGVHSAYTCSPETIRKSVALATEHDVLLSIHLSETQWEVGEVEGRFGKTPAMHLDTLGFFDARTISAHGVWLTGQELELMAQRGASVAHCIESNLKLASGIAPVPAMIDAGINVCIGTDGAASNNDLDMLGELSTAAKVHKAASNNPSALDAVTALRAATVNGASALGLERVGAITPGNRADIILVDFRKPHLTPVYNPCSHMVYSARASDVDTVMINGRLVLDSGELLCANQDEIIGKAAQWSRRINAARAE